MENSEEKKDIENKVNDTLETINSNNSTSEEKNDKEEINKKNDNDITEENNSNTENFSIEEKNSLLEQIKLLKEEKEKAINEERNIIKEQLNKIKKEKEDVEEKLALTKAELHQKTDVFEEISIENVKLKKRLNDEQSKNDRSISLLRGAKNKILKLEKEKKDCLAEIDRQKKANEDLKKEINEKKGDKDKFLFIVENKDKTINELLNEKEKLQQQIEAKDKNIKELNTRLQDETSENLIQSLNKNILEKTEELENYKSKFETTKKSLMEYQKNFQEKEDHIKILVDSITQLQNHNNTLEQELDTSKHLFQVKSDENDKLKFKISEIQSSVSLLESKKTTRR